MPIRELPDLTPQQVIRLQDALLNNADSLFSSALALLEAGRVALAQSLAILGLEESGKAIAVHQRRVQMCRIEDGATFRCEWLDEVWSSHQRKLEIVHQFLEYEDYWFGTGPPEPGENAAVLGTLRRWTRKHDDLKKAGLYVELSRTGEALAPARFTESERLLEVLNRVHQIGWQLRLGEHIEGQEQDRRAEGIPASTPEDVDEWFPSDGTAGREEIRAFSLQGVPGEVLPNTAYRFNPPGGDRKPFDTFGKPGYEAQTRELIALMNDRQEPSEPNDVQGHSPTPEEP